MNNNRSSDWALYKLHFSFKKKRITHRLHHRFTGKIEQLTEIRRTPNDPVYAEAILPEKPGESLADSTLAVSTSRGEINLFFQDHERNVASYENRDSKWNGIISLLIWLLPENVSNEKLKDSLT